MKKPFPVLQLLCASGSGCWVPLARESFAVPVWEISGVLSPLLALCQASWLSVTALAMGFRSSAWLCAVSRGCPQPGQGHGAGSCPHGRCPPGAGMLGAGVLLCCLLQPGLGETWLWRGGMEDNDQAVETFQQFWAGLGAVHKPGSK